MLLINSDNGRLKMRVEAIRMEVYEYDTLSYNYFPNGINVFGYNEEDGLLETTIVADEARHDKYTKGGEEIWSAYGNVVVKNILKREKIETDTLYWDAKNTREVMLPFAWSNFKGFRLEVRKDENESFKVWIDDIVIKKHGKPYEGPAHYPFRNEI